MRSQQPAHRRRSLSVAVARLSVQGPRLRVLHLARCSGAVLPRSRAPRSAGSTDPLQQSHAVAYTVRRCCCSPRVHKCCLARSSSCLLALTLQSEVDSKPHLTLSGGCRSAAGLLATQHLSDAAAWAAAQLAIASSLHRRSLAYRQSKRKGVAQCGCCAHRLPGASTSATGWSGSNTCLHNNGFLLPMEPLQGGRKRWAQMRLGLTWPDKIYKLSGLIRQVGLIGSSLTVSTTRRSAAVAGQPWVSSPGSN